MLDTLKFDEREKDEVKDGLVEVLDVDVNNPDGVTTTDADATDADPDCVRKDDADTLGVVVPVVSIDMVSRADADDNELNDTFRDRVVDSVADGEFVVLPLIKTENVADKVAEGDTVPVALMFAEAESAADALNTGEAEFCEDFETDGLDDGENVEIVEDDGMVDLDIEKVVLGVVLVVEIADDVKIAVTVGDTLTVPLDVKTAESVRDKVPDEESVTVVDKEGVLVELVHIEKFEDADVDADAKAGVDVAMLVNVSIPETDATTLPDTVDVIETEDDGVVAVLTLIEAQDVTDAVNESAEDGEFDELVDCVADTDALMSVDKDSDDEKVGLWVEGVVTDINSDDDADKLTVPVFEVVGDDIIDAVLDTDCVAHGVADAQPEPEKVTVPVLLCPLVGVIEAETDTLAQPEFEKLSIDVFEAMTVTLSECEAVGDSVTDEETDSDEVAVVQRVPLAEKVIKIDGVVVALSVDDAESERSVDSVPDVDGDALIDAVTEIVKDTETENVADTV